MPHLTSLFASGADPWVVRGPDGLLYFSSSEGGTTLALRRAKTLAGLADSPLVRVFSPPAGTDYSRELWAPELHFQNDRPWFSVAADDGRNENHRMWAVEGDSPDPFSCGWKVHGPLATDGWAIDGTILTEGDSHYFLWSGWPGTINETQRLYIALLDGLINLGPRVEISRPEHDWECRGAGGDGNLPTINEGPQVLQKGGLTHIVYSASGSWSDHYCLGRLTKNADADPLNPASWTKHPEPVFESGNGILAPGHASFLTDGGHDWILYHAAQFPGAGWRRRVRAQTFSWENDTPVFGAPIPD